MVVLFSKASVVVIMLASAKKTVSLVVERF